MTNILDLPTNIVAASRKSAANLAPRSDRTPHGSGSSASLAAQLDHLQLQLEHAQAMADQPPDLFLKAAMSIASLNSFTVLNRFDTDVLITPA
jgi:hypothetical protein